MKKYYFIVGTKRKGPFTAEEIIEKKLSPETLIWAEGLHNWTKLKDISDLVMIMPPPIPNDIKSKKRKYRYKLKGKGTIILLIWICINLFALITSYMELMPFADYSPSKEKFWPFTNIFYYVTYGGVNTYYKMQFNGFFLDYDWTEFITYTICGLLLLFVVMNLKKPVFRLKTSIGKNKCPNCGKMNSNNRIQCTCGYVFDKALYQRVTELKEVKATHLRRFENLIIDSIIISGLTILINSLSFNYDINSNEFYIEILIISTFYYLIFEYFTQRTPAKWITFTKVIGYDGNRPSFLMVLVRSICRWIPFERIIYALGGPLLHDRISKTNVIIA